MKALFLCMVVVACAGKRTSEMAMESIRRDIGDVRSAQRDLEERVKTMEEKFSLLVSEMDGLRDSLGRIEKETESEEGDENRVVLIPPEPVVQPTASPEEGKEGEEDEGDFLFKEAEEAFTHGEVGKAMSLFADFLKSYPRHPMAGDALFYIGEGFFRQEEYLLAVRQFERVLQEFPRGDKAPLALLRIALCYEKLRDDDAAMKALKRLVAGYPSTEAAQSAREKLNRKKLMK